MYPANVVVVGVSDSVVAVAVAVAEGGSLTATPVNVCKRGGMVVRECEVGVRMRRRRGEEISLDCDFDGPVVFGGVVAAGDDGGDRFILEVVFECVVVCWLVDCIFEDDMDRLRRWRIGGADGGGFAELRTSSKLYFISTHPYTFVSVAVPRVALPGKTIIIIVQTSHAVENHYCPHRHICTSYGGRQG